MPHEILAPISRPLPRIIVGTASMGSPLPAGLVSASSRRSAFSHLDQVLELGCFAFDTAAAYMAGGTERLLGEWISSRRNRDQLCLISKGAHPHLLLGTSRLTPGAIAQDLNASLRRLKTDHLDLYLLHRDDPAVPVEPIVEALAGSQKAGKIGGWGVSNWTHDRIQAANEFAQRSSLPPIVASSPHFSLIDWTSPPWRGCVSIAGAAGKSERAFYASARLPVLAWSPLGRGFFSGKPGAERAGLRTYGSAANLARKKRAEALAKRKDAETAQVALAYLFHQPFPVSAIVAASTAQKMRKNLEAAALRLTEAEVRWLESGEEANPEER